MTTPRQVRLAALGVLTEGVVALVVAGVMVAAGLTFSVWGFLLLLGAGITVAGVALLLGRRAARGPSLVVQLLTLGCAFYAAVPSGRPDWGVPVLVLAGAVLAALVSRPARDWAASA